jgi:hypothetical protein
MVVGGVEVGGGASGCWPWRRELLLSDHEYRGADVGPCQFCGAVLEGSVHECVEIFELGFGGLEHISRQEHIFRFFIVDAHALQHPELHGRGSSHFHLARLVAVLDGGVVWEYSDSPRSSTVLDAHKTGVPNQRLAPPRTGERGTHNVSDVQAVRDDDTAYKAEIRAWARPIHSAWASEHEKVLPVVRRFPATLL